MNPQDLIDWKRSLAVVRRPKYNIGQVVTTRYGQYGIIHTVYGGLMAAYNGMSIPRPSHFLAQQEVPAKTPSDGIWYGVLLDRGDVLEGEDDIVIAKEPA